MYEPFQRLIAEQQLAAHRHCGFWACMDTLKEKKLFDDMYSRGDTPWTVWEQSEEEKRAHHASFLLNSKLYTPNANGFHPKVSSYAQAGN